MGEAGVTKALEIIHKELDISMAFCGHTQLTNVGREILVPGSFRAVEAPAAGSPSAAEQGG